MEKDSNTLYGYIYSLNLTKFFLQATTWLFGYSVARAYIEASPVMEVIAATVFGIIISAAIDGPLSLLLKDLLSPGQHPAYKWALAVGFSILTGSTTFVSGVFLGEAKAGSLGNEQRNEILAQSRKVHDEQLARLDRDMDEIQGKIISLNDKFNRDTAAIISNMTPNHRMLYRTGKYKAYFRTSTTLKENVDRIGALSTALQLELSSLKGRRYTITQARDKLAAMDPEAVGKEKVGVIDERNAKMGALISGSIYTVDIVAILLTWALFFLIRDKASAGAKMDIETSSLTRWLLDRTAILQNKLLSAFSGADDEIAEAARMFISIPIGLIQLLAWVAGLFSAAITFPTRMYRPRPLVRNPRATPPPPDQPGPTVVPVRAGAGDMYELQRRQEMTEARIEAIRQETERKAEEARQKEAELSRQIEEKNRQIEAEKRKLSEEKTRQKAELSEKSKPKKPDSQKPKPLSDKKTGQVSAKVVGNKVQFDGKTYNLSELSKLTDYAATVYNRQFTLGTPKGRQKNADRWAAIKPILISLGYEIEYRTGNRVSLTGGKKIHA